MSERESILLQVIIVSLMGGMASGACAITGFDKHSLWPILLALIPFLGAVIYALYLGDRLVRSG